jgi:hypothetical protein
MKFVTVAFLSSCIALSGCGSTLPLVFIDKTSVGISASTDNGGVEVSVGFDTKSAAIIPVAVRQKDKDGNVTSIVPLQAEEGSKKDAYSTFGNFTSDTKADGKNIAVGVGLGRFFATGMAAQNISNELGKAMVEKAKK